MNDDCDTQDAMEYLTAQFRRLSESTGNSVADVDLFLQELFESKLRDVQITYIIFKNYICFEKSFFMRNVFI